VPDGTTAQVRCPTCRTVFAPAAGLAPPPLPLPPPPAPPPRRPREEDDDRPRRRREREDDYDEDDDRPRRKRRREDDYDDEPDDDADRPEKRRKPPDDGLTLAERQVRAAQFGRATWGCRLLYYGLALQAVGLLLVVAFLARNAVMGPLPGLVVCAGILGLLNWVLGAAGVGLVLAGRPVPGLYRFGIAAAVAVAVHLLFLLVLVGKRGDGSPMPGVEPGEADAWGLLPTKLDSLAFYLSSVVYPDEQRFVPRGAVALTFITGLAEVVRLVLVMVLLSYAARAAGDLELVHRCVRAAGVGSLGPAGLAGVMLLMLGALVETGAIDRGFGKILLDVFVMGIYAILAGMLVPAAVAARDTAEACEFPFQSQHFEIGD
jgi:hypothetical protein